MRRLLVPAACIAAALTACGGDNDATGPTTTVKRGQAVRVVGHEYRFQPNAVLVSGGKEQVRLRFANEGSLAHNLRVKRGDNDLGGTPTFQGGERSASLKLAPGDYRMICTVGDHAKLGMKGVLHVRE
jgi:plastocyanin